ncbi:hypothetical protein [Pseudolabrys sp.]|uniref:hypothetical protein n=1 Tax=Pseudolabrys sp. TaxID=1960880 RepID=UPI003D14792E
MTEVTQGKSGSPDTFVRLVLGCVAALLVAGVIGLFGMSNTLVRMDERMTAVVGEYVAQKKTLDEHTKALSDHERRITTIEVRK